MLTADELHVWTLALDEASLQVRPAQMLPAQTLLSQPPLRVRGRLVHAGLRVLLGSYLDIDPRAVEIVRGANGRPELGAAHHSMLSFNLSHTAGLAVYAFGRRPAIGVDVEAIDRRAPTPGVIERALNAREAAVVKRVEGAKRTAAFLGYWTVKEAYAKACGVGLSVGLRGVGVEGSDEDCPGLELPGGAGGWHARRLRPRAGVLGAVVANGAPWSRMRVRELTLH